MTATRPPPFFIGDNLGLDFLNTIAVPVDTKVEWLSSGADLLAWLEQAGLVPGDVLAASQKSAVPGELDDIAAQARALRDWFKLFVYKHMGRPLQPTALRELEPLNQRPRAKVTGRIELLVRVPITLEKALQPQYIGAIGAADNHRTAGSTLKQIHTAQDQGPHDPLTEFRLLDEKIA